MAIFVLAGQCVLAGRVQQRGDLRRATCANWAARMTGAKGTTEAEGNRNNPRVGAQVRATVGVGKGGEGAVGGRLLGGEEAGECGGRKGTEQAVNLRGHQLGRDSRFETFAGNRRLTPLEESSTSERSRERGVASRQQ